MCYILVTKNEVICLTEKNALMFKGHPLRRKDSLLYYGSMSDKYIVMIQILGTKSVAPAAGSSAKELQVASKVSIQLQLTDPSLSSKERVAKSAERSSLYAAMDVAVIWLERALRE